MEQFDLYADMARRSGGDIYIGVVGPVRTGKSTFIKRFMDLFVLPAAAPGPARDRMTDELPQSGAGRTIMTTQPKFVPSEAAELKLRDGVSCRVRLVDCVGYMVDGALGHTENDEPRMVTTPWSEEDIPFEEAAEIGTRRVITEHATVGVLVTTDGSFTGIAREAYVPAEERVVREMRALGKPFIVLLNTSAPGGEEARELAARLEERYGVTVIAADVTALESDDLHYLLEKLLLEFPVTELRVRLPRWVRALPQSHELPRRLCDGLFAASEGVARMRDAEAMVERFGPGLQLETLDLSTGVATYAAEIGRETFYRVLSEECGAEVADDFALMSMMKQLVHAKREYDRIAPALEAVRNDGYGLVAPSMEELTLAEPEIVRTGGRYGVRLRASAPSLHLIRVDINTEICPVIGSEKQSEEMLRYLLSEFESDPSGIWESNIFGKTLNELVRESLAGKLMHMPAEIRTKVANTLSRVINEGSGGLLCILL